MDYLTEEKERFLKDNRKLFSEKDFQEVKLLVENLDADFFEKVLNVKLKNPFQMVLISFIFGSIGVDRFMLGDTKAGIIKLLTSGGFFVWWIIDIFRISKLTKNWNINTIRCLLSGVDIPETAAEKFENLKNNKELQKVLLKGAKNIADSAKGVGDTFWI